MANWKDWSEGWLREGFYVSYLRDGVTYYERITARDFAHYVYTWPETVEPDGVSGPYVPEDLQVTRGYDERTNTNYFWQVIFGIKGQVYIYVELPSDVHRHGLPKRPKPTKDLREVSHFEEWMSPFHEPSFITEHFMMRPDTYRIALSAYNPTSISVKPELNFFIARIITERIGTEEAGRLTPAQAKFAEVLEKLHRRTIPVRPITLMPVRAPAVAPAGE